MNILHVNEHLSYRGGVETYLYALLPLLSQEEMTNSLAYASGEEILHEGSHQVPSIGTAGFSAERQSREQMGALLDRVRPDVVHVHNVQNVGVLKASVGSVPTVLSAHDYRWVCPANSFFHRRTGEICGRTCGPGCFATTLTNRCVSLRPQYGPYFYRRARWTIEHASDFSSVIAPSRGCRERYVEGGFDPDQMTVLPYFCGFEPAEQPRQRPQPPVITYVGRIAPNKGHEYFVRALGALPESVRGVMVGVDSAEAAAELDDLAERCGCAARLETRGWASRDEVRQVLRNSSVLIFPSLWPETMGIIGIEALSQGVPVVASDVGGVREWCRDGETGYLVDPKDSEEIASRVDDLLTKPARLRAFGVSGIELVEEKFAPPHHARRLANIYRDTAR